MRKRLLLTVFLLLLLAGNTALAAAAEAETVTGKIIDVYTVETETFPEYHLTVLILDGRYKDQTIEKTFSQIDHSQWDFIPEKDQRLVLCTYAAGEGFDVNIISLSRQSHLTLLSVIFTVLLLIFGRTKGLLSLIALIISGIILYVFFIPLVLDGYDIMTLTVLTAIAITMISFVILCGFTKKSLASILGMTCGIVCAAILSEIFCRICVITGAIDEDVYLLASQYNIDLNFADLFVAGIIIGTIGVVMDVSMSITSLIFELKEKSPKMGYAELVSSGLNVGKDMMATMINTLILAYVGTSLPLLFIFITSSSSPVYAINTETVAGEIIRSLCGSIGLILTVPMTSIIASYIVIKGRHARPNRHIYR